MLSSGWVRCFLPVLIEGPKACGKTATARWQAASKVLLDVDANAQRAVLIGPSLVLAGDEPWLIDEWQTAPEVWNYVRRAADTRPRTGRFILTGSAAPTDDTTRHSGAGRISRMRMRPMSLFELGISSGEVSLGRTLRSVPVAAGAPDVTVPELIEIMCGGGWPGILDADLRQALQFSRDYLDEVRRTEVYRLAGIRRDPNRLLRLMRSLARHVATPVPVTTLSRDTGGPEGQLRGDTVSAYLDALERLFVVEDQPAYSTHLRARSRLRLPPKRHFVEPFTSGGRSALQSGPTPRRPGDVRVSVRVSGGVRSADICPGQRRRGLSLQGQHRTRGGRDHRNR